MGWECDFHPKSKEYSRKVFHSIPRRGPFPLLLLPLGHDPGRTLPSVAVFSTRTRTRLIGHWQDLARVQHQVQVGQQERCWCRCSDAEFWWPCPTSRCPKRSRWFAFRERHILAPRLCGMFRAGDLRGGVRAGALAAHSGGALWRRAPSR